MYDSAVLIVNYNKRDLLIKCLDSIFASDKPNFDVFVLDNASTDDSVKAVKERFGEKVTLLVNEENTGGSGGFNRGMKHISEMGCYKYLIEFDNDILVNPDTISELRSYMEKRPEVGICGATIIDANSPNVIYEMGAVIDVENFGLKVPLHQTRFKDLPYDIECDYAAFGASIIRVDALKQVGLADSSFFLLWDDIEFCWRLRKVGLKVRAISSAVVYHYSPSAYRTPFGSYYSLRNKIVCFARHTTDDEFENLAEKITKRFFRIMVVNTNTPERSNAYTHALFDALNGIMGKAEEYKVVPLPSEQTWSRFIKEKKNILLQDSVGFTQMEALISFIRNISTAPINVISQNPAIKDLNLLDACVINGTETDNYNMNIVTCPHVLDFDYKSSSIIKGKTLIWDNYQNFAFGESDFTAFSEYAKYYPMFHSMLYMIIRDKLRILRQEYLKSV